MNRARLVLASLGVFALAACGLSIEGTGADVNAIDPSADAAGADGPSSAIGAMTSDGSIAPGSDGSIALLEGGATDANGTLDAGADVKVASSPPMWGVTVDKLYRFDPNAASLTLVGSLTGCANTSDIAVDATGKMFATGDALYTVSTATGACTTVAAMAQPFTLTFVPKGTLHASSEGLVAYLVSDYVEIDRTSGTVTAVKELAINPYTPSGDVVSAIDAGTWVSVLDSSCATDCILQVSPIDGSIVKNWGPSGYKGVVGLAISGGVLYGFLASGDIVRFSFANGAVTGTVVPIATKPTFIGAGSSTVD